LSYEIRDANRFDSLPDRIPIVTRVDNEAACRLNVVDGDMESLSNRRSKTTLNFDRPYAEPSRQFEHKIDFGTVRRSIKTHLCACGRNRNQILDDESFPARSDHRMTRDLV